MCLLTIYSLHTCYVHPQQNDCFLQLFTTILLSTLSYPDDINTSLSVKLLSKRLYICVCLTGKRVQSITEGIECFDKRNTLSLRLVTAVYT